LHDAGRIVVEDVLVVGHGGEGAAHPHRAYAAHEHGAFRLARQNGGGQDAEGRHQGQESFHRHCLLKFFEGHGRVTSSDNRPDPT